MSASKPSGLRIHASNDNEKDEPENEAVRVRFASDKVLPHGSSGSVHAGKRTRTTFDHEPQGFKPLSNEVRIMTWNILAHGLSDDGFLVRDDDSEEAKEAFRETVARVTAAKKVYKADPEQMAALQQELATPEAKDVHNRVLNWEGRIAAIVKQIRELDPDIFVLQEVLQKAAFEPNTFSSSCAHAT